MVPSDGLTVIVSVHNTTVTHIAGYITNLIAAVQLRRTQSDVQTRRDNYRLYWFRWGEDTPFFVSCWSTQGHAGGVHVVCYTNYVYDIRVFVRFLLVCESDRH